MSETTTTPIKPADQVTDEDFIKAIEQAVEQRGEDFVYQSRFTTEGACRYAAYPKEGGEVEPACIVGMAYTILTGELADPNTISGAEDFIAKRLPRVSQNVAFAARSAQIQQDGGRPWGAALGTFHTSLAHNSGGVAMTQHAVRGKI